MSDRDHKILAATLPCAGKKGVEPKWRFVIVAWFYPDGKLREYSTHVDIIEGGGGPGLHNGHYFRKWEDAFKEFIERVDSHNAFYREGNVSHIPGIDFMGCGCDILNNRDDIIDTDKHRDGIQGRAEKTRRTLSKEGKGKYLEG